MAFHSVEHLLRAALDRPLWEAVLLDDLRDRGVEREASWTRMAGLWEAMRASVAGYDPDKRSACGLTGGAAAKVEAAGVELSHAYLPDRALADAQALAAAMPELGFECHLGGLIYTYRPNEITHRHIHKLGCPFVECGLEEMPRPWTKLLAQHADHAVLQKAQEWVDRECPGLYEPIFSNNYLLEITAAGATKGDAVLKVAGMLGIRREHLYCVGDNQNDIPMLAVAAQGFAPANCAPTVRDWGATVVGPCEEGAIADVIEILDRKY